MTITSQDAVAVSSFLYDDVLSELGLSSPTANQILVINRAIIATTGSVNKFIRYDPLLKEHVEYHPQQPFQAQISRGIWEVMESRAVLRQVSEAATNELQLQHLPLRGDPLVIVRVDYDGRSEARASSFPASSQKTMGQDYWPNYDSVDSAGVKVCRDGVLRTIGLWPTTPGTVKVTYTAGYKDSELRGTDGTLDASPIWDTLIQESVRRVRRALSMANGVLGMPAGIKTSERMGDYSYSVDAGSLKRLFGGDLLASSQSALSEYVNMGFSLGS